MSSLPSQALRAPDNLMKFTMLFVMMPSFCPRTSALAPDGMEGHSLGAKGF